MCQLYRAYFHPERWVHDGNHVLWLHRFHCHSVPQGEAKSEAGGQQHDVLDYRLFNWQIVQFGCLQSLVVKMQQNRKGPHWDSHCQLSYSPSTQQAPDSAQAHVVSNVFYDDSVVVCAALLGVGSCTWILELVVGYVLSHGVINDSLKEMLLKY